MMVLMTMIMILRCVYVAQSLRYRRYGPYATFYIQTSRSIVPKRFIFFSSDSFDASERLQISQDISTNSSDGRIYTLRYYHHHNHHHNHRSKQPTHPINTSGEETVVVMHNTHIVAPSTDILLDKSCWSDAPWMMILKDERKKNAEKIFGAFVCKTNSLYLALRTKPQQHREETFILAVHIRRYNREVPPFSARHIIYWTLIGDLSSPFILVHTETKKKNLC